MNKFLPLALGFLFAAAPAGAYQSISVSPSWVDFYQVEVNQSGFERTITVTNTGDEDLSFVNVNAFGDSWEFRVMNWCPMTLTRYATCTVAVEFNPRSAGFHSVDLVVSAGIQRADVTVRGEGIEHHR